MLEYARQRFALRREDPRTKKSRLQTLLDIKTQTGLVTGELNSLVPLPSETAYLWEWYQDLEIARQASMGGPLPIPWAEIEAYFRLRRIRADAWEVDTIRTLDAEYMVSLTDAPAPAVASASTFRDVMNEPTADRPGRS